jgi:hypothetical protein
MKPLAPSHVVHLIGVFSPIDSSHPKFPLIVPVMSSLEVGINEWTKSREEGVRFFPLLSRLQCPKPFLKTVLGGICGKGKVGAFLATLLKSMTMNYFCFHSPQTASGFCKNSARSLVAFYHNGALPCECHPAGAIGQHCNPEGGQCPCRPNVIGRQCTRCASGHYGFPHCKRK